MHLSPSCDIIVFASCVTVMMSCDIIDFASCVTVVMSCDIIDFASCGTVMMSCDIMACVAWQASTPRLATVGGLVGGGGGRD